jgi:phospholipid transport system transporter-binding protein
VSAAITEVESGVFQLSGVLDSRSGPQLRQAGQQLIAASAGADLLIDCSAVERSSSVGLSLLLCFMRDAAALGKRLAVQGLPADMRQMAQVSGLDEMLPVAE